MWIVHIYHTWIRLYKFCIACNTIDLVRGRIFGSSPPFHSFIFTWCNSSLFLANFCKYFSIQFCIMYRFRPPTQEFATENIEYKRMDQGWFKSQKVAKIKAGEGHVKTYLSTLYNVHCWGCASGKVWTDVLIGRYLIRVAVSEHGPISDAP